MAIRRVLGNDPFKRGAAEREDLAAPSPSRPLQPPTPELVTPRARRTSAKVEIVEPSKKKPRAAPAPSSVRRGAKAKAGADVPRASPARPIAHRHAPSTLDLEPHPGAPTATAVRGPIPHQQAPATRDVTPHAAAPTGTLTTGPLPHRQSPTALDVTPQSVPDLAQALKNTGDFTSATKGPVPHRQSPTALNVTTEAAAAEPLPHSHSPNLLDVRPHAAAPEGTPLTGPVGHTQSPHAIDVHIHAAVPIGISLKGPVAHPQSPSAVDVAVHSEAPTGLPLSGPLAHTASPQAVDVSAHPDAPTGTELEGPVAHPASPRAVDREPDPTHQLLEARAPRSLGRSLTQTLSGLVGAARTALGFAGPQVQVDTWGKDAGLARSLRPIAELMYERYWRVRVDGAANLPTGPCIIVANHAGALPLDGPVLHLALKRERPELAESRWLLEDQVFYAPFVGVLANRLGAVRASPENALQLLEENRPLIVFPEGFHGLSKPFSERYQLRRFGRGGYLKVALRAGVPVIPAAIVGGEESMPLLAKLPGGLFGVQYLPLTLPPLPARWHICFAEPVTLAEAPANASDDAAWVGRTNERVRGTIEGLLTTMLKDRGRVF